MKIQGPEVGANLKQRAAYTYASAGGVIQLSFLVKRFSRCFCKVDVLGVMWVLLFCFGIYAHGVFACLYPCLHACVHVCMHACRDYMLTSGVFLHPSIFQHSAELRAGPFG